jgi:maleate cis-trans isomerase
MLGALEAAGLSLRDGGCMGIEDDLAVGLLEPDEIERFVLAQELTPGPGDRVFVSCTNLRVAECADSLSRRLGCTVTSSNLAILEALEPMLAH